jgi:ferredoxin-NADP reductase
MLVVISATEVARDVVSLALADPDRRPLPAWTPGAHLDLVLPSGLIRSYSLHGDPADSGTYRIAVLRVAGGRGGSVEMHTVAAPGLVLEARGPRNTFALGPAEHYLFLAGGIGVTPLLAMARDAARRGVGWTFVYGGRSLDRMAFADEIAGLPGGRLVLVPQNSAGLPDLAAAFAAAPAGSHAYCCGPGGMLDAAVATGKRVRPEVPVWLERFGAAAPAPEAGDQPVEVTLARSGITLTVPAGVSILDAVRARRPGVLSNCEQGTCSACETVVLDGVPDHRDTVLTPRERAAGRHMMICVSRAISDRLVLDL